ncbi:two-component sensor histidine kinase [Clostridia bacterium]|nr:two-component sensor histidine kinase [Clostridia bacterium]
MSTRKSLFMRYLSISLLIVFISFFILGIMLVFFVTQYSENEKQTLLSQNVQAVSNMISYNSTTYENSLYIYPSALNGLSSVVSTVANSIDGDVIITDADGNILMCTLGNSYDSHTAIPSQILANSLAAPSFTVTTLGSIYNKNHFVAGSPIIGNNGQESVVVGAVFATTEASSFTDFTSEIIKIFLLASISTFVIVFCISGFFTYNMVKPLRQMSFAAKSFGAGDFSIRVPVTSNDEIGHLAFAFNNMANSLAVSESTRRSFIANVSHELKTPMTTIAGFIDGILDGTIPPETQKHYLHIVSVEVRRLSRLVTSMLALSRIDNGELKINNQRFDLTDTVINILLSFEHKISERNLTIKGLEKTTSVLVNGDPDLIHQVVYNLVENAVKFTNTGGYIEIIFDQRPDKVTLEIKNSGHGIEPEELRHIFERFYKTDKSRSQDKNGMGLGLYIVKTIMRLHGGDITAQSEVNNYCSFALWLPKEKEKITVKPGKFKD